jgi:general stress protein 26
MSEKSAKADTELDETGTVGELVELLKEFRTAILVTRDSKGLPRARPLALLRCETDGTLWFSTSPSPKVDELAADSSVAVICHRPRDEAWVSVSGRARVMKDPAKAKELWNVGMKAWFEGPDDPALLLIEVKPAHAEYYEPSKPFVVRAFEMVKGMVTNEPPKTGTTKHVEMDRLSDPGRLSN